MELITFLKAALLLKRWWPAVEQRLAAGAPVLLEIELEGARQVRKSFPQAFQIFLKPPSMAVLEARIRGRGTEQEGAIQRRLARAEQELKAEVEFDAVVENNELADALAQLELLMGFSQEQTTCPEIND
jgi:guanylate kinase